MNAANYAPFSLLEPYLHTARSAIAGNAGGRCIGGHSARRAATRLRMASTANGLNPGISLLGPISALVKNTANKISVIGTMPMHSISCTIPGCNGATKESGASLWGLWHGTTPSILYKTHQFFCGYIPGA